MSALDKLERRLGFIAVPGLLRYVAALTALVFILYKLDSRYLTLIDLDPNAVRHGQVWRLVTYIFIPQMGSLIPRLTGSTLFSRSSFLSGWVTGLRKCGAHSGLRSLF